VTDIDPEREWYYSITLCHGDTRRSVDGVTKQGVCTTRQELIDWIARRLDYPFNAIEVHHLERNDL
jgi:hypothetical protein